MGWADVATKDDLHALRRELELRFDAVDRRFDAVPTKAEMQRELRIGFAATVAANTTIIGLVVAALSVL